MVDFPPQGSNSQLIYPYKNNKVPNATKVFGEQIWQTNLGGKPGSNTGYK